MCPPSTGDIGTLVFHSLFVNNDLINCNKVVSYFIEDGKFGIHSMFDGSPVQTTKHARYAGCVVVPSS